MTFKEAISLYILKYERLSFGKVVPTIDEERALTDISIALSEINNNHYIAEKQTTLSITNGVDKYVCGSNSNNIPYDIHSIITFSLNDDAGTALTPVSISAIRGYVKNSDIPYTFCLYLNNANKVLELNNLPNGNFLATIFYVPKVDIYYGAGGDNTKTIWKDFDKSLTGYGGTLPIDDMFNNAVIERALAEVFPDRLPLSMSILNEALINRPVIFDTQLPDYFDNESEVTR